ncbi:MAG TPA: hypothetical protein VFS19_05615 [Planctomycetota bacterium]|nr:hypothetical protein [Planctomycetota bacterium]
MSMRALALAATLAALPAAAPTPQAKDAGVIWASSWEEAKIEAEERNVPIFFTVQQDENPGCKQMESAFRDGSFIAASRRVVCVVSNPDTKHGVREVMVGKVKTPFCRAYDGITCDVHTRCQNVIANFVDTKSGSFDIPMQIWCRPNGTELFKFTGPNGSGVQTAPGLIKDLERALDRISGAHMSKRDWEEIKKLLQDGDEAQVKTEYKLALACFKKVMDCKFEKFAARGKERYEGFIKQMVNVVSRALKQYEKAAKDSPQQKEVKPLLQKIAKEMKGTEAGTAADDALKQIK